MSAKRRSGKIIDLRGKLTASRGQARLSLYEKRRSPLRARKRRRRVIFALCLALLMGIAAWGIHYTSYLPRFSIHRIEVVGAKDTSPAVVRAFAETQLAGGSLAFFSRGNIFFYPRSALARAIEEHFPRIRSVSISRESLLGQVAVVAVEERQPFAEWCSDQGECYLLDESGFVFDSTATSTDSHIPTKYTFTGALGGSATSPLGQTFLSEHFAAVIAFLEQLEQANFSAQKISIDNEEDFSASLVRGYALRASFRSNPEDTVRNLELVLSSDTLRGKENELEYIDLRFGNRVYYKFREQ